MSTPIKQKSIPVTLQDFYPVSTWKVDKKGERWTKLLSGTMTQKYVYCPYERNEGGYWKLDYSKITDAKYKDLEPMYVIDQSTNNKYWNESKNVTRLKCFLLTFGTPFVHTVASIANIAYRILKLVTLSHFWVKKEGEENYILKLVTLSHFWVKKEGEENYSFTARLKDAEVDLLRIVTTPLTIVGLELSAIFGLLTPRNGRKLYASFERAQYGNFILAPCFQPSPQQHALGGDPDKPNQF